jgi:hypothetical protein
VRVSYRCRGTASHYHDAVHVQRELISATRPVVVANLVQVFDEQEAQFHLHLDGAKGILSDLYRRQRQHLVSDFLMDWVLYYDVLSGFTRPTINDRDDLSVSCYLDRERPVPNMVSTVPTRVPKLG